MADRPGGEASGVAFVDELSRHGVRPALVTPDGAALSYLELADLVDHVRSEIGGGRRLVLVEAADEVGAVVGELAAMAGRHPVVLAGTEVARDAALATFDPDVVISADGEVHHRRVRPAHDLHPDLALLLSTSGTIGSAKLVRLSARGVDANARAIADYLELSAVDRAVTTLPMAYCYGLSVLHSHLAAGASVVLSGLSVADEGFPDRLRTLEVTSFAGVPHTFELLDRVGFERWELPRLRTVTQAGGRLAPERVRQLAALGRRRGWRFVVMYGQTEATARMAYLPPELAERRPEAIGRPISGGALRVDPVPGAGLGHGVGELVYRGPNVMFGYAEGPGDLARGREVDELRTGDLAVRAPDGLYEIRGRLGRFVKPFGLRVDLDEVERLGSGVAGDVLCAGDDDGVVVATTDAGRAGDLGARLGEHMGLPRAAVRVVVLDELPRLGNGKPDYPAVLALGRDRPGAGAATSLADGGGASDHDGRGNRVDAVLATVLGVERIADDDTFVSLGGDSLSYVEASVQLEQILGTLPERWQHLTVAELRAVRPRPAGARLDATIALRALAIVGVVVAHAGLAPMVGGAHVLLAVAGLNAARFTIGSHAPGWWRRGLRQVAKVGLVTVAYLGAAALVVDGIAASTVGLASGYVGEGTWRYRYWFVEVFVQLSLVLLGLLAVPGLRLLERTRPFAVALALLVAALAVRGLEVGAPGWDELKAHSVAWLFALGWAAERARYRGQRLVLTAVAALALPGAFATPGRGVVLLGVGLLLVVWCPTVPVPARLHRPIGVLAGASLAIYLTHWQVLELTAPVVGPVLATATALAVGVVAGSAAARLARRWPRLSERALGALPRRHAATGLGAAPTP